MHLNFYEPPASSCWQGRTDSLPNERFFQRVQPIDLQNGPIPEQATVLLGFASDEGIRRNHGRPGASAGPYAFREQLARLAAGQAPAFYDAGNIVCREQRLEEAQQELALVITELHAHKCRTLVIGGGHEVAFGHFSGLSKVYSKLGIINFDAHFDLRMPDPAFYSTSGTPFFQIASLCEENNQPFRYGCIGIQLQSNTRSLLETAERLKVEYMTAEQMSTSHLAWQTAFLDDLMISQDAIYLSICMDVFAECYAPGVSAPQALGITPWQALPLLKYILQTGKVVSLDMAELSPPLDNHQQTARLAAHIAAQLLEFYE